MCGRYVLSILPDALVEMFGLGRLETPETGAALGLPRYNIAPTQTVAVTLSESPDALSAVQWGLIPSWAKEAALGSRLINARGETIADKPAFRAAFKRRRCVVYASGFYEWRKEDPTGKVKTPLYIQLKSAEAFAMAGLWEVWKSPEGALRRTCTIVTTEPNELLSRVHNRMPVILPAEARAIWLDLEAPLDAVGSVVRSYAADDMRFHEVSRRVNTPRNEDATLVESIGGVA
ncbi:MAG: SOS response-associated peptidase [Thermoflexales bacterium]